MSESEKEYWCVVGNIRKHQPSESTEGLEQSGTRMFKEGARVSIVGAYDGACSEIIVIGQERKKGKFTNCILSVNKVEGLRVKRIYRPRTTEFLSCFKPNGARIIRSKVEAEEFMRLLKAWQKSNECAS